MAVNHDPTVTSPETGVSGRLDGRLRGRAQEWLTRKMAYGFLPPPRGEADCRQRYHLMRELYADGDGIYTELWRVPPHARGSKDQPLFARIEREVEEVRVLQEALRAQSGIDALVARGGIASRVDFERSEPTLEIRIGPWRSPLMSVALPIWMVISGMLCVNALLGIFGKGPMPWGPVGGLLVGLPFALLAIYAALYWLWNQSGTETVRVNAAGLTLQSDLLHWHGERTFRMEEVRHLRYSRPRRGEASHTVISGPTQFSSPTVAFTYGGTTWRFGGELDEASALAIVAALESRAA